MKNFNQLLQDTALDTIESLDYEIITYVKSAKIGAGSLYERATLGMMTGRPVSLATLGIIKETEEAQMREIKALVNRFPPVDAGPHGQTPLLTISVFNDSDEGIYYKEVDTGRDLIELAVRIGEDVQLRRLTGIITRDPGMLTLRVQ